MTPRTPAPTGRQWTIEHGEWAATVVEVGGGLRTLTRGGEDVVAGYARDETCDSGRGQQLVPWPNRIRDGRYAWAGEEHQLAVTEVPKHNASHGLCRWALWEVVEHEAHRVTVGYRLHPQPGWGHHLELRTTYALDDGGLVVTASARNVGASAAPFGYGAHPYLALAGTPVAEVGLHVPAGAWVEVDERSLPVGTRPVDGTAYDFRTARPVGDHVLDTAYTEVERDPGGLWHVRLDLADRSVALWGDSAFGWLQVFTGKAHEPAGVVGIAVEPMTCPADAFNSGTSLVTLEPGDEWTGTWGIVASAPGGGHAPRIGFAPAR